MTFTWEECYQAAKMQVGKYRLPYSEYEEWATDAAHDVFIAQRGKEIEEPENYLQRAIRNRLLGRLRREGYRTSIQSDSILEKGDQGDCASHIQNRLRAEQIVSRFPILGFYLKNESHREAALAAGVTTAAFKSRMYNQREKARKELANDY